MDDVVQQTVLVREDNRFCLWRGVQIQSVGRSNPRPLATVNKHHTGFLALELKDAVQRRHHGSILYSQGVLPRKNAEVGMDGTVVQQAALLRTHPHTPLQVELYRIDIGLKLTPVVERQLLMVYRLARLQVPRHIAQRRRNVQLTVVDHHVVQMILRAHYLRPLAPRHIIAQQDGPVGSVAIANQVDVAVVHQMYTAAAVEPSVLSAIRCGLIEQLATLQVVALQQPVVVEQEQVFLVDHLNVLQAQTLLQHKLPAVFAAVSIAVTINVACHAVHAEPHVAVHVDKHIVHVTTGTISGEHAVNICEVALRRQVHTAHHILVLQPQVVVVIIIKVVVAVVVLQFVLHLLLAVDMREVSTVVEVDVANRRDGHTARKRAFDGLRRVVGQAVGGRNSAEHASLVRFSFRLKG